jgi:hypothetical protein
MAQMTVVLAGYLRGGCDISLAVFVGALTSPFLLCWFQSRFNLIQMPFKNSRLLREKWLYSMQQRFQARKNILVGI